MAKSRESVPLDGTHKETATVGAHRPSPVRESQNDYLAAEASAQGAKSEADRALLDAQATLLGVNTEVTRLQAELDTAKFQPAQTTVRAPSNSAVLQMFLRPGMYAASMPLRPVMVFMPNEPPCTGEF